MRNAILAFILASSLSWSAAFAQDTDSTAAQAQGLNQTSNDEQPTAQQSDAGTVQNEPAAKKQDKRFYPGSWFVGKIYDGVASPTKLFRKKGSQSAPKTAPPIPTQNLSPYLPPQTQRQFDNLPEQPPSSQPFAESNQYPFDPYTGLPNPGYRGIRSQNNNPSDPLQQSQDPTSAPENKPLPLRAPYPTPYPSYSSPAYSQPSYSSPSYSSSSYRSSSGGAKTQHVSGYFRKNGTYVHSYYRRPRSR